MDAAYKPTRPVAMGLRRVIDAILYVVKASRRAVNAGSCRVSSARGRQCSRTTDACASWPSPETDSGHHRFAVGQDDGKRGQRGNDAGNKAKARKRHIAVNTQGFSCWPWWRIQRAFRIAWARGLC